MKQRNIYVSIIFLIAFFAAVYISFYDKEEFSSIEVASKAETRSDPPPPPPPARVVNLSVPFISEAPENIWKGPWLNGCEEASIAMVAKYYEGKESVGVLEAKEYMEMLFAVQNREYGSNADSDAARTAEIINNHTNFKAVVKDDPTIEEIKEELRNNRPVISPHYGFELNNPNVRFLSTGSWYHMLVIVGFDDEEQQFITHDDGDRVAGANHRYDYELFMDSIHDFVFATRKANGPARVIFTSPN